MKRNVVACVAGGVLGLGWPCAGAAGEPERIHDLEGVTVSATRTADSIEETPRAVTVITGEEIRDRVGSGGIQGLLADVPGIAFARTGGLGGQLVMRGFNTNAGRSIMAIDGDRYRGRSTLEYNMIDPNSVERIEVIRGPASAIYGSDAMAGVVNIVTRRAKVDPDQPFTLRPKLRALEWNSVNDMVGGRVELLGGGNGFDVMLGVNHRQGGDYATPIGDALNSGFNSTGADLAVGFSPSTDSRWELSGRYQRVVSRRAGGLGAAPGEPWLSVREDPIIERYLRLAWEGRKVGSWADSIDASVYVRDFDTDIYQRNSRSPAVTLYNHIKVYTPTVWGGHLTAMKRLGSHALSYGGDFFTESFAGRVNNVDRYSNSTGALVGSTGWKQMERGADQTNLGLFINDNWHVGEKWTLSGSLRGDIVDVRIGDTYPGESPALTQAYQGKTRPRHYAVTGGVGALYEFAPAWQLVGNLSRGFRAPSGMNLTIASIAGTQPTLPSPDLSPETNLTAEAGLRWHGAGSWFRLTAYQSKYRDLITQRLVAPNLYQRQNLGRATIRGVELEARARITPRWSAGLSATYTHARNDISGEPLPYVAPLTANASLRYDGAGWHGEGVLRAFKAKTDIDPTQERRTAGYGMLDLFFGLDMDRVLGSGWRDWKVLAGVENVFNQVGRNPTVTENLSYPNTLVGNPLVEPGRSVVLKLVGTY
ncbi:TonB-dependent receptor [Cupriavidus agavae]|uniref:Hemoglobin/transferrin/lactoferrin receptor protein n=1 Tax=Cupriavidus agavae TaxID=1001822 RepID=A0A4Q7REG8_9BURK|nr:TonB-dependent receptor [Cupriavidus agavae]RZT30798.1 hemoglobin/transferrin/lactoferrin receptor protein [Cupriavidus agavae]